MDANRDRGKLWFSLSVYLIFLLSGLFTANPALAEGTGDFRFERLWPALPQPWYFSGPSDVALDQKGFVYVADGSNKRIVKLAPSGAIVSAWPVGDGSEPLAAVAVDSGNFVYVLRAWGGPLEKFDRNGNRVAQVLADNTLLSPTAMDIGPDGNLYVTCGGQDPDGPLAQQVTQTHLVWVFSPNGEYLRSWGTPGTGPGNLGHDAGTSSGPTGIAVAVDGRVFVADSLNQRVQVYSGSGQFLTGWGSEGDENGQFRYPDGILVNNSNGHVYVADADWRTNHIQRFTLDGTFVDRFYQQPPGDGAYFDPVGMAQGPDGVLFVADTGGNRVYQFNADGTPKIIWQSQGDAAGQFNNPGGIDVATDGTVYVADHDNDRIQKFSSSGTLLDIWNGGDYAVGRGAFSSPKDVEAHGAHVYVASYAHNNVVKFTTGGAYVTSWLVGEGDGHVPQGLAVDADGQIYVAIHTESAPGTYRQGILKYTDTGVLITRWDWATEAWGGPLRMDVGPDGTLYAAAGGEDSIYRFSLNGQLLNSWPVAPAQDGAAGYSAPLGVAVTADGTVWTVHNGKTLRGFSANGTLLAEILYQGTEPGEIQGPGGLAVGPAGEIFVADTGNHRVQVFVPQTAQVVQQRVSSKAILLAGGGAQSSNIIWDATQLLANLAYNALRLQGFTKDEVKYLSAVTNIDLDNNGLLDDLEPATLAGLQQAITDWAKDADEVVIYLVDHGGPERFRVNETEILTAGQLVQWIQQLEQNISGRVILVIEACESGSFLPALAAVPNNKRIVITSTAVEEIAYILNRGLISFSYYFWGGINQGADLEQSFSRARNGTSPFQKSGRPQYPQLDSDGDSQTTAADLSGVEGLCLGNCVRYASDPPQIIDLSPDKDLTGERTDNLWVRLSSLQPIINAWAVVERPDFIHGDSTEPVDEMPKVALQCDDTGYCTGKYKRFDVQGDYRISFFAEDRRLKFTSPMTATFRQTVGPAPAAAVFDTGSSSLRLSDVAVGSRHFYVELTHQGSLLFELANFAVKESAQTQDASFEGGSGILHLPRVYVDGDFYDATLQHLGNWLFSVTAAHPVP